ncbi:MAG TPA: glycosyltransferase family 2 protein [Candidatus Kapabacteria bacterium]|nr:glycosyltransferase family 2 protein [Candidatus Kapabacteria bacterium]
MKLSLIVVNWNTVDLLRQTLRSVVSTGITDSYELIVIDNHSADESVDMVRNEFPEVTLIVNSENRGFSKANNQGMAIAKGEYLCLLNSDTIVKEGAIQTLVHYLDTHPDVMMVGPRLLNADGSFQHSCRRRLPTPTNSFYHLFGFAALFPNHKKITAYKQYAEDPNSTGSVEAISGAAMMFRRHVYETIGGLDEQFFMYGEDLDFCKRVKDKGWKTVYVADAVIVHLNGGSSKKRRRASIMNFYDAMWLYYKKHFKETHPFPVQAIIWLGIHVRKQIALLFQRNKK